MGMGHSPDLGPPYLESVTGLNGKDPPLLRQTQTGAYRDRDQWSRRVAGLLKASETCLGCPRGTTAAAAAIAETKKRQRRERLRARQSDDPDVQQQPPRRSGLEPCKPEAFVPPLLHRESCDWYLWR